MGILTAQAQLRNFSSWWPAVGEPEFVDSLADARARRNIGNSMCIQHRFGASWPVNPLPTFAAGGGGPVRNGHSLLRGLAAPASDQHDVADGLLSRSGERTDSVAGAIMLSTARST